MRHRVLLEALGQGARQVEDMPRITHINQIERTACGRRSSLAVMHFVTDFVEPVGGRR